MTDATARDLEAIRLLMEQSQNGVRDAGRHFLIWGTATSLGLLGTYAAIRTAAFSPGVAMGLPMAIALVASFWTGYRESAAARVANMMNRVAAGIWMGTTIGIVLLVSASLFWNAFPPEMLSTPVSLLIGGAFFASSFTYRKTWMVVAAVAWWAAGIALAFWRTPESLLVMAALVIASDVVPGLSMLRAASRRDPTGT